MKVFALLLSYTVSIDAVAHQPSHDYAPLQVNEQSSPITKSPAVTRRLNILQSITTSADQQNDELSPSMEYCDDILGPEDNECVNDILQQLLDGFTVTMSSPSELHYGVQSKPRVLINRDDSAVFQSLSMMLSNPKDSLSSTPWQDYVKESIGNQQCSVIDLCRRYHQNFKCDDEGHLELIRVDDKQQCEHYNLLMIPNTVKILSLRRTKLKTISEWTDLRGKLLRSLQIQQNVDLKLNLDGLKGPLDYLPLKHLIVSRRQIKEYFGIGTFDQMEPAFPRIAEWMKTTTLVTFRVASGQSCGTRKQRTVYFYADGSWTRFGGKEQI